MIRKYSITFIVAVFISMGVNAQIRFEGVGPKSKKTILSLYNHLLSLPTDTTQLKDTTGKLFRFYDNIIGSYFNKVEMAKAFEKFGYSHLLQYEVLKGIDIRIDSQKTDSIFVMSGKMYLQKYVDNIGQNLERTGRIIAGVLESTGTPKALLDIEINNEGKFIYMAPIIHFQ